VDNIKMDLRETGWGGMNCVDPVQDRVRLRVLVNTVINLRIPENFGKFLVGCTTGGFSGRARQLKEFS
jgi:hypothetical protein